MKQEKMYEVQVLKKVKKNLIDLHPEIYKRVIKVLEDLAENPKPQGLLKLAGRDGFRLRVGDYRIIYDIDDVNKIVTVLDIGHRSSVYKS